MAVDWGSVADWFSGIGSIAVGSAALAVAFLERKRAVRAEDALARRENAALLDYRREVLRTVEPVYLTATRMQNRLGAQNYEGFDAIMREWAARCRDVRSAASTLQRYPIADARIYSFLIDVMEVADLPKGFAHEELVRLLRKMTDAMQDTIFFLRSQATSIQKD